jgi:membrane protease YdiL (CAAX protease family)
LFTIPIIVLGIRMTRGRPDPLLLGALGYGGVVLALLWRGWRTGLRWSRLFGPAPRASELPLVLGVVPVALFTLAATLLVYVPLSYPFPGFVTRHLLSQEFLAPRSLREWWMLFLIGIVLAPVVEELFFRGILMQRWAYRWGTRTGVIASSIAFAVGHGEWLGHFAFGVLLCAIYLRTRRLWVSMLAHALNNFVVVMSLLPNALSGRTEPADTLASFRAQLWSAAPLLVAAGVTAWVYGRRYWPAGVVRAVVEGPVPYEVAEGRAWKR